jgi:hypothetical protein
MMQANGSIKLFAFLEANGDRRPLMMVQAPGFIEVTSCWYIKTMRRMYLNPHDLVEVSRMKVSGGKPPVVILAKENNPLIGRYEASLNFAGRVVEVDGFYVKDEKVKAITTAKNKLFGMLKVGFINGNAFIRNNPQSFYFAEKELQDA